MVYVRSLVVWILLMLTETLHGTARIFLLVPLTGDFRARQISVFTGALLIFGVTALFIRWIKPADKLQCLAIGAGWVLLTVGFEVALGVWVFHMPWSRITEDYNLMNGGLMPVGLLCMLLTPLLAARWHGVLKQA